MIKGQPFLLIFLLQATLFLGCSKTDNEQVLPSIQTVAISNITTKSAYSGGTEIRNNGQLIEEKGVCWDTKPNPTITLQTKTTNGQGEEPFTSLITNLQANQQYYVRAFARSNTGVAYGNQISFTTNKENTLVYKADGRTVRAGEPLPIILDITNDGQVDFTIFLELTAGSKGDRLYAGINPIGYNQIKAGVAIPENFLSMGFLVPEPAGAIIDSSLNNDQRWTSDHNALVIRNTLTNGQITYEGSWSNSPQVVAIQNNINGSIYFGWLRVDFDKNTEIVTLIDYAYNTTPNQFITSADKSN